MAVRENATALFLAGQVTGALALLQENARVMPLWRQYDELLELERARCRYEVLVTETELKRICAFLGIELNQAMLDLQSRLAARGRLRTNSYQQVAEPVYSRSKGRWKHYEGHFAEAFLLLERYIAHYGYGAAASTDGQT